MNNFIRVRSKQQGYSLIELVVGIVVLGIALVSMNAMLISQGSGAIEPIHRLRASQLGQSILQDILSRAYDQNSDHSGGIYRCGEIWGDKALWFDSSSNGWTTGGRVSLVPCSRVLGLDSDEKDGEHEKYNDVDDFIENKYVSAATYGDVLGGDFEQQQQMQNYFVKITVVEIKKNGLKEITVTIKTPTNQEIVFAALKGNY